MSFDRGSLFNVVALGDETIVHFVGPKLPPQANDPLFALVEEEGRRRLVLDFSNIRFLSSNALAILVMLKKKVEEAGGRLKTCCLAPDLIEMLRVTRIDGLFELYGSQQEAIDAP